MKYAMLLMLIAPFAVQAGDCTHNWMQCPVGSSLQINSFTIQAAATIGGITAKRAAATKALQRHTMTVAQAKVVLAETGLGRQLWDSARAVCHAGAHGNCDTAADSSKAFALLDLARGTLK